MDKDKANSLSERMENLSKQFDVADELITTGEAAQGIIQSETQEIELFKDKIPPIEVINLQIMVDDFTYIRDTLKESTANGRRVLNILTRDLLDKKINQELRANLITSFAEMNTAVCNNMKLYILSYKEISIALLNIDKYKKENSGNKDNPDGIPKTINNTFNISTTDLIKALKNDES